MKTSGMLVRTFESKEINMGAVMELYLTPKRKSLITSASIPDTRDE